jgi:type II secretion system protein G
MTRLSRGSGFTLIELLIVVVILGIVAAIVIPTFVDASTDAKVSALKTNLHTVRAQLELYKIQHNDAYPANADFINAMTVGDALGGPYMLSIPTNPFTNAATVGNGAMGASAWFYDNGIFRANDTAANAAY